MSAPSLTLINSNRMASLNRYYTYNLLIKVTGCLSLCLYRRILPTTESICSLSQVLGRFITILGEGATTLIGKNASRKKNLSKFSFTFFVRYNYPIHHKKKFSFLVLKLQKSYFSFFVPFDFRALLLWMLSSLLMFNLIC